MNKFLTIIALLILIGFSQTSQSRDYDHDSYNDGYDHGYDDEGSIDQKRILTDPAYEDGVMDGEDEADREHVEGGGSLNYPHPDSY
jgi:hypothetical protein|tara:strand:+ start:178 stop:435 length:258 start_codon:yes stop_codon:yes gene_type:complete